MKRAEFEQSFVLDPMPFDPASRFPNDDRVYLECRLCGDIVGSRRSEPAECSCGNLMVDYDAGSLHPRYGHGTVLVFHARPRRL